MKGSDMLETIRPARVVAPGRILQRELDARDWTQKDLASITGRPAQAINEIIRGAKQITPETAIDLAAALGTSPEFWTNLEANYRLHLAAKTKNNDDVARRSRLYERAPVRELSKRGWIKATESIDDLEAQVCGFLGVSSISESPGVAVNFRHSESRGPEINAKIAWVKRVEQLARSQDVTDFDMARLAASIVEITKLSWQAPDVERVPATLAALGVHFTIVPQLPRTYIDGAALYVDGRPTVALTLRYDRIDAFWFTLLHELAHILAGHDDLHIDNMEEPGTDGIEVEANNQARNWLLNPQAFEQFVSTNSPRFSKQQVEQFALSQRRHPGIIVGQLHHQGHLDYKNLRSLLVKVRPHLEPWIDRVAA